MSIADVFLFKADISNHKNSPKSAQKKAVSRIARSFVTAHISRVTGISADRLEFSYGAHGKPYIKENPIYFNVSHCGNLVLAAFCSEEIGADIELVRKSNGSVVERFFTDDEKSYINLSENQEETDRRFFEVWTAKESFLKLWGVGISGGLDFCTADEKGVRNEIFSPKFGRTEIVHRGGKITVDKNDIIGRNISQGFDGSVVYQVAVCGRQLEGINFQFLKSCV